MRVPQSHHCVLVGSTYVSGSVTKSPTRPTASRPPLGPKNGSTMHGPSGTPHTPRVWPKSSSCFWIPASEATSIRPNKPMDELMKIREKSSRAGANLPCNTLLIHHADIVDVREEVAHAHANRLRQDPLIALRDGLQRVLVQHFIELVDAAIERLERVARDPFRSRSPPESVSSSVTAANRTLDRGQAVDMSYSLFNLLSRLFTREVLSLYQPFLALGQPGGQGRDFATLAIRQPGMLIDRDGPRIHPKNGWTLCYTDPTDGVRRPSPAGRQPCYKK